MSNTPNGDPKAPSSSDEISLIEIMTAVLRSWRAVLLLPLLFAFLAGAMALRQKRSYVATASFIPQTAENRNVGGAAALAQQFGVSLGTDRPGHSPAFYVDLLESATILRRAVESQYEVPSKTNQAKTATLVEYWKLNVANAPVPPWRSALERLRGAVAASVIRETGVVEIRVSADDPFLAEQITERLLELLNEYNLEMRQGRAKEEARFISGRLTEIQNELTAAENALEAFLSQNRNFRNSPQLTFEHDRLQRQVLMRQEVYASLLRAQEQARFDGVRDTPLLTIIDYPAGTASPASRGVVLRILMGFMLGFLLAVALASVREAARRGRQTNDPYFRELEDSVRRLLNDLRHPRRWLGNGAERITARNE